MTEAHLEEILGCCSLMWNELLMSVHVTASVNGFKANLNKSLSPKFQLTSSYVCTSATHEFLEDNINITLHYKI